MFLSLVFFFLMIRRPPRSTLFPTRRSSDLVLPVTSLGYAASVLIGRFFLSEQITPQRWAGTLLIVVGTVLVGLGRDRKSTRLNSSHVEISYAVFCLKKKKIKISVYSSEYNT